MSMMRSCLEEEGKRALQTKQTTCDGLETGKCDGCRVKKNQAPPGSLVSCEPVRYLPGTFCASCSSGTVLGSSLQSQFAEDPDQCSGEHALPQQCWVHELLEKPHVYSMPDPYQFLVSN